MRRPGRNFFFPPILALVSGFTAVLQAEVLCISNCTLVVGGGEALTIDEFNHAEYTAGDPDPSLTYLSKDNPYGSTDRLLKYIGWRIEAAASGGWEACFRLTLVLK